MTVPTLVILTPGAAATHNPLKLWLGQHDRLAQTSAATLTARRAATPSPLPCAIGSRP
jgi:hypothetical protein